MQVTPHEHARYVRNLEDNGKDGKDIYANTLTPLFCLILSVFVPTITDGAC